MGLYPLGSGNSRMDAIVEVEAFSKDGSCYHYYRKAVGNERFYLGFVGTEEDLEVVSMDSAPEHCNKCDGLMEFNVMVSDGGKGWC